MYTPMELKVLADVGSAYTKLLLVHESKDDTLILEADEIDMNALPHKYTSPNDYAKQLAQLIIKWVRIQGINKAQEIKIDLALSPPLLYERIIQFYKAPPYTETVTDFAQPVSFNWRYLGEKENAFEKESAYALLTVVEPGLGAAIYQEFIDQGLTLQLYSSPVYNLIRLAYLADQTNPHLNRIMLDCGASGTRVAIIEDGIPVYCTEIAIGTKQYVEYLTDTFESMKEQEALNLLRRVGLRRTLSPKEVYDLFEVRGLDQHKYYNTVENLSRILLSNIHVIAYTFFNGNENVAVTYSGRMIPGLKPFLSSGDFEAQPFDPLLLYQHGLPIRLSPHVRVDSTYFGALAMAAGQI